MAKSNLACRSRLKRVSFKKSTFVNYIGPGITIFMGVFYVRCYCCFKAKTKVSDVAQDVSER